MHVQLPLFVFNLPYQCSIPHIHIQLPRAVQDLEAACMACPAFSSSPEASDALALCLCDPGHFGLHPNQPKIKPNLKPKLEPSLEA
jgi:hypothetical protein